jgi:N-acetylglucosamine-6-phosphate deacetylase
MSTHLGNGSHALIPRHSNYIWEQLASDDLYASIIADGHHLPESVLKTFVRAKGAHRVTLISDAVSLGGLPPGRYDDGKREVLPSGKVVVAGTPYLSGAGHLQDTCVAHAVRHTDLSLDQAIRCVTEVPAQILGLERKGRLRTGADADVTLFRLPDEGPLEIVATVRGGDIVYRV